MTSPVVDWTSFARSYDLFLKYNPAYQDIVKACRTELEKWRIPPGGWIGDIGGGTGNFSLEAGRLHPQARILHMDADPGMLAVARSKRDQALVGNLTFVRGLVQQGCLRPASLSGAICVHMLYATPKPQEALKTIRSWLCPGAPLFLCDLGRVVDLNDWRRFFFRHLRRQFGLLKAAMILWQGREIGRQNAVIRARQLDGTYWTHSLEEFTATVLDSGFDILETRTCNRDYSDLIIARA